jgi:hypothetical protein
MDKFFALRRFTAWALSSQERMEQAVTDGMSAMGISSQLAQFYASGSVLLFACTMALASIETTIHKIGGEQISGNIVGLTHWVSYPAFVLSVGMLTYFWLRFVFPYLGSSLWQGKHHRSGILAEGAAYLLAFAFVAQFAVNALGSAAFAEFALIGFNVTLFGCVVAFWLAGLFHILEDRNT